MKSKVSLQVEFDAKDVIIHVVEQNGIVLTFSESITLFHMLGSLMEKLKERGEYRDEMGRLLKQ